MCDSAPEQSLAHPSKHPNTHEPKHPPHTHTHSICLQARERDWANVITAHAGEGAAYTWRLAHFTLGQHVLLPPDAPTHQRQQHLLPPVTAVAISCCGNFGLVGTEAGRVDRYNLQSGIHRGTYGRQQQQQQQQAIGAGETCARGRDAFSAR